MARKMGIADTGKMEVPVRHFLQWQVLLITLVVLAIVGGGIILGLSRTTWENPGTPSGGVVPPVSTETPTPTPAATPSPTPLPKIEVEWESSQLPAAEAYPHGIAIVDSRGERLFATGYYRGEDWKGALWKSEDGGRSWSKVIDGYFTTNIILDPTNPRVMYLGTMSEVLKSIDGGNTWTIHLRRGITGDVEIDKEGTWWHYSSGSTAHILKSMDAGQTWIEAGRTPWGTIVPGIRRDPNNPNIVLQATYDPGDTDPITNLPFWKFELSTNGGKDWQRVNMPPPFKEKSDFGMMRTNFAIISTEKEIKIFFAKYQAWRTTIPLESLPH